eukprot:TRINITY_DN375_c0_g3_i1.p1 TRINITY_DN375_c0_g3~~TRINITY_DN375_c0_g3_i1.p1  ORF type:complete len:112 (+),score=29.04 TRINITY_DN375_c0_g3_i1:86-421(+)
MFAARAILSRGVVRGARSYCSLPVMKPAMFGTADVDKNGFLEVDELNILLKNQGCNLSKEQVTSLLDLMDTDKDGKVSFDEFQNYLYTVDFEGATDEEALSSHCVRELASI